MVKTRRVFVKESGIALFATGILPPFLERVVAATTATRKVLVVLFQRGAADGLNTVIPFGDPAYYAARPSLAIARPSADALAALDLDGFFGLHPALASLAPLYQQKQLAIVHAAGSPDSSRSHFDAQDYMESGTPGVKSTRDGWLNRALREDPAGTTPFRAVALGPSLPRILQGSASAVALPDIRQFRVQAPPQVAGGFETIYAQTVDTRLGRTGRETFAAIDLLRKADPARLQPENGAQYPRGRFGQPLLQVAQLIKAGIGMEVAFLDGGGWDTHVNQGAGEGQLANLLREMADSLAAFHRDLGDRMEDVVVVTMSEFGRTVAENGNRGTDHGHANCMFVLGGPVQGGKVYGTWPGLAPEQLFESRDLALTTDFRTVLSEILAAHHGVRQLATVFPGFDLVRRQHLGLLRT